jgi:hypothetical protein
MRLDVPHIRSIESAARNDFDELISSFAIGESASYILRGFEINMVGAIGSSASALQLIVAESSLFHGKSNISGTFFQVPVGTPSETLNSTTNTKVDGAFTPSSLNYVGLELKREVDAASVSQVFFWNPTNQTEFSKSTPLAELLDYEVVITSTIWDPNVIPLAIVSTDASNAVLSVEDRRPMFFRLGTAGETSPDPAYVYPWDNHSEGRTENPFVSTSSVSPFRGGDKQIKHLKEWADAVMSQIKEIKGTTYWYSFNSGGSIFKLRNDVVNTQITGSGSISHSDATAGLLNWNQDFFITFVTSRLQFKIAANPDPGTDLQLADNEVAYIRTVRGEPITPRLILTNGSAIVTSVGAVPWTSDVQAGDFIKLASSDDTGYYEILSVDSLSQVTLTVNYNEASTGALGDLAQYAWGTYEVDPAPSTDRHIKIAARELVPFDEDVYWLFLRADNGGPVAKVYLHGITGGELEQGEEAEIADNTTLEVLEYIGSPGEANSTPDYTNAVVTGVAEVTTYTFPAAAALTAGQSFEHNGSGDLAKYTFYVIKDSLGSAPPAPGRITIGVNISTGDTNLQVAAAFQAAIDAVADMSAVDNLDGTVTVTNSAVGTATDASNVDMGAGFSISVNTQGVGSANYALIDGENLTRGIKRVDTALAQVAGLVNSNTWKLPVADFASLPLVGNTDGDVRLVLDTRVAYHWDNAQNLWLPLTGGQGLKLVGGGTFSWDLGSGELSFTEDAFIEKPGLPYADNTIPLSESPIVLANNDDVAYVEPNLIASAPPSLSEFNVDYSAELPGFDAAPSLIVGNRLYVNDKSGPTPYNMRILDISDVNNPVVTNTAAFSENEVPGAVLYDSVLNRIGVRYNRGTNSLVMGDLTDPDNPSGLTNYGLPWQLLAAMYRVVAVRNGISYTAGATNVDPSLYVRDVSGPSAVPITSIAYDSFTDLGSNVAAQRADFSADGNTLYVAAGQELHIFDITTPALITSYSSLNLGGLVGVAVRLNANYVAVPIYATGNIAIVDVSNPATPFVDNTFNIPAFTIFTGVDSEIISYDGQRLIVAGTGNQIAIVDVTDPTSPSLTDTFTSPSTNSYSVVGSQSVNLLGSFRANGIVDFWQLLGGSNPLTVVVDTLDNVPPTAVIIARRIDDDVIVGSSSTRLADGESMKLYDSKTDQDKDKMRGADYGFFRSEQQVTWTGTQLQFLSDIVFETINRAGTVQTYTVDVSDSPLALADGEYLYLTIDRTQNTQALSFTTASSVPAIPPAGTDIIVFAKRVDALGVGYLHLVANKQVIEPGQTVRIGASGAGGAGDTQAFIEMVRNRLDDSIYESANIYIAPVDKDDVASIDPSSTGEYDLVTGKFKFTNIGDTLVTAQLLDDVFLAKEKTIDTVEVIADFVEDDPTATYEVSRDGGNEWQAVTMENIPGTKTYYGSHTFDIEASNQTLDEYDSGNINATQTLTDTIELIAQEINIANESVIRDIEVYVNKLGSPVGKFGVKIVKQDVSEPSADPNDIMYISDFRNIADLAGGNNTVSFTLDVPILPGTYYLVFETDADYKLSYDAGVDQLSVSTDASSSIADLQEFNGTIWAAVAGESVCYKIDGIELDLRLRITGSTVDALLQGYAVLFDEKLGNLSYANVLDGITKVSFQAVADNLDTFVLPFEVVNPDLLIVHLLGSGQSFRYGDFTITGGNTVVFPEDQFNNGGIEKTQTLIFDQLRGGAFDNSDVNAALLAENRLGSTNPTLDRSVAGEGILLRSPNGTLFEVSVADDGSIVTGVVS